MIADMRYMHDKYGVHAAIAKLSKDQLKTFLEFRLNFLQEELDEGRKALATENAEEIVDSMIDLIVVALGTLDLFDVDCAKAWREVLTANLNKEVGIKPGRPNPLGLPDLVKPEGWVAPSHAGNHGILTSLFTDETK